MTRRQDPITVALLRRVRDDPRSVVQVAAESGVPRSTLAQALTTHTCLSMWTAIRLAHFYGMRLTLRMEKIE